MKILELVNAIQMILMVMITLSISIEWLMLSSIGGKSPDIKKKMVHYVILFEQLIGQRHEEPITPLYTNVFWEVAYDFFLMEVQEVKYMRMQAPYEHILN